MTGDQPPNYIRRSARPPASFGAAPPAPSAQPPAAVVPPPISAERVAADRIEAERLLGEITRRLPAAVATLAAVRQVAADEAGRAEASRKSQLGLAHSQADEQRGKARETADRWAVEVAASAAQQVTSAAAGLAPGAAGEGWEQADRWQPSTSPARYLRFGDLRQFAGSVPALAPFLASRGWVVEADAGHAGDAVDFLRSVLLRLLAVVPLKRLRLITYDPKTSGSLGMFAPLRGANAATFPPPIIDRVALCAQLRECQATASRNAEQISAHGAHDLLDLWERLGVPEGDITVVVVLDYPTGIDEETNTLLAGLAEAGPARGVQLLVQLQTDPRPPERVDPEAVLHHLVRFRLAGDDIHTTLFADGMTAQRSLLPETSIGSLLIRRAVAVAAEDRGPTVLLEDVLAPDVETPWEHSSRDGLDLPIGVRGRDPLVLSFRTANPPTAHLLMGGKTGYGKSNVLLDIIYSAALRYGPDELELLLLDFKQGLEFQAFAADSRGENWLPQASVLALESSKTFGLAVLRHTVAELNRRAELFKAVGANVGSIGGYRHATGQRLPRMLLIIDEFQVLFDGDDEETDEAVALLETLARQGRVYGIHLLMASQSISGISGFRTKGEAIFGQFLLRASLFNDAAESQAIFGTHNTAASELTYRGEMILNRNGGTDPERYNERILAAYAEPGFTKALQRTLWQRGPSQPPMVFLGRDFAHWPAAERVDALCAERPAGALRLLAGRPIAITDHPVVIDLRDDVDQAVAVVGSGDDLFEATISALIATAVRNRVPGLRLVILDGLGLEEAGNAWTARMLQDARSHGVDVEVVPRRQVASHLLETVRPELVEGEVPPVPTLYLGLGLQRVVGLARQVTVDPDDLFNTISAADVLAELARNGVANGQYLVATWSNLRTLKDHLCHDLAGVGVFVALRLGSDDLRELAGFGARLDGHPRILVIDRREDLAPQVVVPFTATGSGGGT